MTMVMEKSTWNRYLTGRNKKVLQLLDMRDMGKGGIKDDSKISGFGDINRAIHWDKE